jgi:hypothetical protein
MRLHAACCRTMLLGEVAHAFVACQCILRLKELLRQRLIEHQWRDQLKQYTMSASLPAAVRRHGHQTHHRFPFTPQI